MFGKLLCIASLAGFTLAQSISIPVPAAGSQVHAGASFTVQVARPVPTDTVDDLYIAIGAANCQYGCPNGLGHAILYTGPYNPKSVNSAGKEYQNFTVTAPNYFVGAMDINVAHFYLTGLQNTVELESASVGVTLSGSVG